MELFCLCLILICCCCCTIKRILQLPGKESSSKQPKKKTIYELFAESELKLEQYHQDLQPVYYFYLFHPVSRVAVWVAGPYEIKLSSSFKTKQTVGIPWFQQFHNSWKSSQSFPGCQHVGCNPFKITYQIFILQFITVAKLHFKVATKQYHGWQVTIAWGTALKGPALGRLRNTAWKQLSSQIYKAL